MSEHIERQKAIDAINSHFGFNTEEEYGSAVQEVINGLPSADVVSKADITALLEEIEKELVKDTDKYSIAYNFIVSVMGIIKCKIAQMGEKTDG